MTCNFEAADAARMDKNNGNLKQCVALCSFAICRDASNLSGGVEFARILNFFCIQLAPTFAPVVAYFINSNRETDNAQRIHARPDFNGVGVGLNQLK